MICTYTHTTHVHTHTHTHTLHTHTHAHYTHTHYTHQVHRSLEECQEEVRHLKAERDLYEENMKKAFMRGVCALNMEAMSMFRYHEAEQNGYQGNSDGNHGDGGNGVVHTHSGEQTRPVSTSQNTTEHAQSTPHPFTVSSRVPMTTAPQPSTTRQSHTIPAKNLRVTTSVNPHPAPGQSHTVTRGVTPYAQSNPNINGHQASHRKGNGPKQGRGGVGSAPARHMRPEVVIQKH